MSQDLRRGFLWWQCQGKEQAGNKQGTEGTSWEWAGNGQGSGRDQTEIKQGTGKDAKSHNILGKPESFFLRGKHGKPQALPEQQQAQPWNVSSREGTGVGMGKARPRAAACGMGAAKVSFSPEEPSLPGGRRKDSK